MAMNSKFGWLLSEPVIQAEQPTEITLLKRIVTESKLSLLKMMKC